MTHPTRALSFLFLAAVLAGCGDKGGPPPASDTGQPAPIKGKVVNKASQLHGAWFIETEDEDFVAFEFLDSGKAMVTMDQRGREVLTMDYSLLEGGRLSLVGPMGMTQVFNLKIQGDRVEFTPEVVGKDDQPRQYRRLASGQTIAQAIQLAEQARREAAERRVVELRERTEQLAAAVAKLLAGGHVTIQPVDRTLATTPHIALEIEKVENQRFNGFAYYELPEARKHQLAGVISGQTDRGQVQVQVNIGAMVEPTPDPRNTGGNFAFQVAGEPQAPTITANVRFGAGQPVDMRLAKDEKLHSRIIETLAVTKRVQERAKAPVTSLVKDHAVLVGSKYDPSYNWISPMVVWLDRPEAGDGYDAELWQTQYTARLDVGRNTRAAVELVGGGFPQLKLTSYVLTQTHEHLFNKIDEKAQQLDGQWRYHNASQWHKIQLRVARGWTAQEFEQELTNRADLWRQRLSGDVTLRGMIGSGALRQWLHLPVNLALTVNPDQTVAGQAVFPSVGAQAQVQGQLVDSPHGPKLRLRLGDGQGTPNLGIPVLQWFQPGTLEVAVAWSDGDPHLAGAMRINAQIVTAAQFGLSSPALEKQRRQRLEQLLTAGATFELLAPKAPRHQYAKLTLKLDPDSGQLTGQFDEHGGAVWVAPPATLTGKLDGQEGWTVLSLQVVHPPNTRGAQPTQMQIYLVETLGRLRLLGRSWTAQQPGFMIELAELQP